MTVAVLDRPGFRLPPGSNAGTMPLAFYADHQQALTAWERCIDINSISYVALDPGFLADQIIHAIDQPWGVEIGDITVRASGDGYVL